jgi:putative endonuclease
MASTDRARLGRAGEDAALAWYEAAGYALIARNWRCKAGEIDLVLRRAGELVFCEVKTRGGPRFGAGYESVTAAKQARLRRLAELFLLSERIRFASSVRLDVASVMLRRGAQPDVQIFDDAF